MVKIGSNNFENVTFPLAFEDRYFMLEPSSGTDIWTVFTVQNGAPIIEILKNEPVDNDVTKVRTNPTRIVTVIDLTTGAFLYKLRPGDRNSSIFGRIRGEDTEIRIRDKEIHIGTSVFHNNTIVGFPVGIMVDKDGGITMGAPLPLELQTMFHI